MMKTKQDLLIENIITLDLLEQEMVSFDCARLKFVNNIYTKDIKEID